MKNLFKLDDSGSRVARSGVKYTVVAANSSVDFPKKDGWRESLEEALKVKPKQTKAPTPKAGDLNLG